MKRGSAKRGGVKQMANKTDGAKRADEWQPRKASDKNKPHKLTDPGIEALREFGHVGVFPDSQVPAFASASAYGKRVGFSFSNIA